MKKYNFQIYEYEEISRQELSQDNIDKLSKYLKKNNYENIISYTANGIKATQYVGIIKHNNIQIQIFPKILKNNESEKLNNNKDKNNIIKNTINNLIYMLSYTKKLTIKSTEYTGLYNSSNPFFEILIREYANSLFECLKKHYPKVYIRKEENLSFMKGKLKINENIRYNSCNQAKFYCEYDEFSEDNILNQLFYFVSVCLYNISTDSQNKKILNLIKNFYSDKVSYRYINSQKARTIFLFRNQAIFEKPFNLAKMFLDNSSIDMSKNSIQNITLLWDMNKLFEEFIAEIFKRNDKINKNYNVKIQHNKKLFKDGNKNTSVDILLENKNNKNKIILDTKYKECNNISNSSNNDIYQISTYCLIHGCKKAGLIYPLFTNTNDVDNNLTTNLTTLNVPEKNEEIKIKFITIDLSVNLKEKIEDIENDLQVRVLDFN